MNKPSLVAALCVIGVLQGCQLPQVSPSGPPSTSKVHQVFIEYSTKAKELETQGELGKALLYWQIVATVQPNTLEVQDNITRLEDKIRGELTYYLNVARTENANGNHANAIPYLLNALAIAPDDPDAIRIMQDTKRAEMLKNIPNQPKKIKSQKSENANVDEMFELGLSLISTDKTKARELFESILAIDPSHLAARAYLEVLLED